LNFIFLVEGSHFLGGGIRAALPWAGSFPGFKRSISTEGSDHGLQFLSLLCPVDCRRVPLPFSLTFPNFVCLTPGPFTCFCSFALHLPPPKTTPPPPLPVLFPNWLCTFFFFFFFVSHIYPCFLKVPPRRNFLFPPLRVWRFLILGKGLFPSSNKFLPWIPPGPVGRVCWARDGCAQSPLLSHNALFFFSFSFNVFLLAFSTDLFPFFFPDFCEADDFLGGPLPRWSPMRPTCPPPTFRR